MTTPDSTTISVSLDPEVWEALEREAQAAGQTIEEYAVAVLKELVAEFDI